jgi:hypothetical protein
MGLLVDPWEPSSLIGLPAEMLDLDLKVLCNTLKRLNDDGHRLSFSQADKVFQRFLNERSEPYLWGELTAVLGAVSLARRPKALEMIEYAMKSGDESMENAAVRCLCAYHGMPELFYLANDMVDNVNFSQYSQSVRDVGYGIGFRTSWARIGLEAFFDDTDEDLISEYSKAFERMGMPRQARALAFTFTAYRSGKYEASELPLEQVSNQLFDENPWLGLERELAQFAVLHSKEIRKELYGWHGEVPPDVL